MDAGRLAVGDATRVVLRPIANPLPLGFLALAGGTLVVAALQLGWIDPAEGHNVGLVLVAFVFPLQLAASVFGFLARDVIAATGMGLLAGTWLSVGLVTLTSPAGSTSDALGLLLLVAAIAMLVPAAAASMSKIAATAVLGLTALRFATAGVYELSGREAWSDITGVVGLALCAVAVYVALAMVLEDAQRRTLLPLGRRDDGRDAMDDDFRGQVSGVQHEAGVREQA